MAHIVVLGAGIGGMPACNPPLAHRALQAEPDIGLLLPCNVVVRLFLSMVVCAAALSVSAVAADAQRQAEVAKLGADVMPFSLKDTTHIFTKTSDGGSQRVVAKNAGNAKQIELVREHLRDSRGQFLKGDFAGPTYIHGSEMPGLAELKAAKPGQIAIEYKDVDAGAELTYRTADATLVAALHRWFDSQLSDHGADAMAAHTHHHPAQ